MVNKCVVQEKRDSMKIQEKVISLDICCIDNIMLVKSELLSCCLLKDLEEALQADAVVTQWAKSKDDVQRKVSAALTTSIDRPRTKQIQWF